MRKSKRRSIGGAPQPDRREDQRWEQGLRSFRKGDFPAAVSVWTACKRPGVETAMSEAYLRQALTTKDPTEARVCLEKACRLVPTDPRPVYHLGLWHFRAGDIAQATAQVDKAVELRPEETRYRQTRTLLAAIAGQPGPDWRTRILGATSSRTWPEPPPAAPAWLAPLLSAMAAASRGDWEDTVSRGEAALACAGLPEKARETATYYRDLARIAGGHDRAVPAGQGHGPHGTKLAAAALSLALEHRDAHGAEAILRNAGKTLRALRPAALVHIGLLYAETGEPGQAVRVWSAVTDPRIDLGQPIALALERSGEIERACACWEQVLAAARRGVVPPEEHLEQGLVVLALTRHLSELWESAHDTPKAIQYREEALAAEGGNLPAARYMELVEMYDRGTRGSPKAHRRMMELLEAAVQADPEHPQAWQRLDILYRRCGHLAKAKDTGLRLLDANPDDSGAAIRAAEDHGRLFLLAVQHQDLDLAARCLWSMQRRALELPPETRLSFRVLADLAMEVLSRVQKGGRGSTAFTQWDGAFGELKSGRLPPSAYALRAFLALLRGAHRQAENYFYDVHFAPYWQDQKDGDGAHLFYVRWAGFAHCHARQIRAKGPLTDCANNEQCDVMWSYLTRAARNHPASLQRPIPPCLSGCPELPDLYRRWQKRTDRVVGQLSDWRIRDQDEQEAMMAWMDNHQGALQ